MRLQPVGVGVKIEKESKLVPLATIIGALAGILIIIVAARASFPVYLYYTAVIFLLVAIFSLLIYGFLAHPIYNFIKKRRETRKHNALARKYFGEFKDFTDRFGEFIQSDINIPHILDELCSQEEFRSISLFQTNEIRNLFYLFEERLKRFNGTEEDFSLLVEEFDTILKIYNKYCVCKPVEEVRIIGRDKVNERIKEEYIRHKTKYERFVDDYIEFGKRINKDFGGKRVFRTHFKTPKEL